MLCVFIFFRFEGFVFLGVLLLGSREARREKVITSMGNDECLILRPKINENKTEKIKEEQEKIEEEKRIRKNMEKQTRILEEFLALDEEIQKDITKQAETYYHGSEDTLEMFKKVSYMSYLKAIYKELLRIIKDNYPKLLLEIEGEDI